jgi:predicted dehydrogenase
MHNFKKINRRNFVRNSTIALGSFSLVPPHVVSGLGHIPPSDKLNVAGIGIGGMGKNDITDIAITENIVALCDADWSDRVNNVFKTYPPAKQYKDYRVMLDKQKDIDAVIVATADHTHAVISMEAIKRGKHVYTEKPLTHTIYEARMLTKAAREYKVATQMGNQGQADDEPRRLREMIWSGIIGPVHEVHVWTDRPNRGLSDTYWPQGVIRPADTPPFPQSLDWDLFIEPAPMQLYHPSYHPFKWRGWWDFGTGALGDIGCHRFDPEKLCFPNIPEADQFLHYEYRAGWRL